MWPSLGSLFGFLIRPHLESKTVVYKQARFRLRFRPLYNIKSQKLMKNKNVGWGELLSGGSREELTLSSFRLLTEFNSLKLLNRKPCCLAGCLVALSF